MVRVSGLAGLRLALVALAACAAVPALATPVRDCPLRDAPFSIDTPMLDLLTSTAARATVERVRPGLIRSLTPRMREPTPPSFGAIVTPRSYAELRREDTAALAPLDAALRRLPVTAADRAARCARYDADRVRIDLPAGRPRILLFEKMTGFRDGPSVDAAAAAVEAIARRRGWALVRTDRAGVMTPATLRRFDAVVWNNVSGDVLTLSQRRAFRRFVERGGGFVGIHGSAGDPTWFWDWYADTLIGARFRGHPLGPQFQPARIVVEPGAGGIVAGLPPAWTMTDEWYSFRTSPRATGARVLATLDEASYVPVAFGLDLRMGDHPIAWTRCVGRGRSFYSAIGHMPAAYADANHLRLVERGIAWAADRAAADCARR